MIQVHGAIVGGTRLPLGGRAVSDERIIATVRAARLQRRVRGVVLHIDSPGGSALASDRMHHELCQLAREKPVVACMGNVAASGGYYIAAAAHEIVAQPVTVTGSIGVVAARFIIEPLLHRLGITTETLQRGAHAGLLDAGKPLDEEERAALDREIGGIYDAFVDVVAQGRNKPREAILKVAEGRVWSGRDAHQHGLVDTLGGLDVAIGSVSKRLGAPASSLDVAVLRPPMSRINPLALPRAAPQGILPKLVPLLVGVDELGLFFCSGPERVLAWSALAAALGWE